MDEISKLLNKLVKGDSSPDKRKSDEIERLANPGGNQQGGGNTSKKSNDFVAVNNDPESVDHPQNFMTFVTKQQKDAKNNEMQEIVESGNLKGDKNPEWKRPYAFHIPIDANQKEALSVAVAEGFKVIRPFQF